MKKVDHGAQRKEKAVKFKDLSDVTTHSSLLERIWIRVTQMEKVIF